MTSRRHAEHSILLIHATLGGGGIGQNSLIYGQVRARSERANVSLWVMSQLG